VKGADLILKSRRVITPQGLAPAAVFISGERISAVSPYDRFRASGPVVDVGDSVVMAGLVDTHVHFNDPGRAEWEGFETGTRAAAAGGITTVLDMPLNSRPVTTSLSALNEKRAACEGRLHVDCGFWGGVVPGNDGELEPMIDAGVFGFKCFLVHSGIDDFPAVAEKDLRQAMAVLARRRVPLLAHAELARAPAPVAKEPRKYKGYLDSRPKAWENDAIALLARLSRETGCRAHIVHLSSAEALPLIAEARRKGAPLTVETCPHYLTFCAEEVPDGRTEYKCAPPIREAANREALWKAFPEGLIDFVVSDHSPCSPELKRLAEGDFSAAWGGIAGLQLTLPAVWTQASRRGFGLSDAALWLSSNPARFAALGARKGRLAPGCDADIVVWDPEAAFEVAPNMIQHRHKVTPYSGLRLQGKVRMTVLRGRQVYHEGAFPSGPQGRALTRATKEHELDGTH
jgi:allantoinase